MRTLAFLALFAVILACGLLFLFSYRYRDISSAAISQLSDFNKFLMVTPLGWTIKNAEFDTICFTGNNVFALAQAKSFLSPNEANTRSALGFAGGLADLFNGSSDTSIVLLSGQNAQIFQLDRRLGFALKNVGCMAASQAKIQIKSIDSITELELPNASLGVTHG
jgi:hypothetical protein